MKSVKTVREYYLQVVKAGEYPRWPRLEAELVINHRPLGSGYIQCWAFLKKDNGDLREVPPAEILAQKFPESSPFIVIDQPTEDLLELILVSDRHAWAHTFSSPENLEDNIESIVDFAKKKFDIKVDNFMTTGNVDPDIDKKLDEIEKDGKERSMESSDSHLTEEPEDKNPISDLSDLRSTSAQSELSEEPDSWEIKKVRTPYLNPFPGVGSFKRSDGQQLRSSNNLQSTSSGTSSKFSVILPLLVLLVIFGGLIANREMVSNKISGKLSPAPTPTVIPTPTPTPTPTPISVERKQYKLRVLNGTNKAGAAAALATKLKDLGWQVTETGNAKVRDVEQTTLATKDSFKSATDTLVKDLTGQFEASVSGILKSSDKVDAEIVIGNK